MSVHPKCVYVHLCVCVCVLCVLCVLCVMCMCVCAYVYRMCVRAYMLLWACTRSLCAGFLVGTRNLSGLWWQCRTLISYIKVVKGGFVVADSLTT